MQEYINTAVNNVAQKVTDLVFLEIQNNAILMHEYLIHVEESGLKNVNMEIGKAVLEKFQLQKLETRSYHPISTLIQSHQEYETK